MRALKQDAKEKRYGRICLLLGIILLGTVGCSHTVSDTPSIDAEIAEFLQVSESQAESLWEGIQTIDQNSRAEKTTVHVRQAFGNEREMYVLYDVTFSTEIDLQKRGEQRNPTYNGDPVWCRGSVESREGRKRIYHRDKWSDDHVSLLF